LTAAKDNGHGAERPWRDRVEQDEGLEPGTTGLWLLRMRAVEKDNTARGAAITSLESPPRSVGGGVAGNEGGYSAP
jgi:hypothetical protein